MKYLLTFIICIPILLHAQTSNEYQNYYPFKIYSEHVEDTFHILISLPAEYNNTNRNYPVIYLLDADRSFGMVRDILRWLEFAGEMPPVILIGIAYSEDWWQKRSRDYTPYPDELNTWGEWPLAGGAPNYTSFLEDELEEKLNTFRIDKTDKAIIGHSLGGLFCLHVMFTNPDLFDKYLIISPAVIWNNYAVLEDTQKLMRNKNQIKVFTAIGNLEDQKKLLLPWNRLNEMVAQTNFQNMVWETRLYENQTHISVMPVAMTDGLKFLFNN